MPRIFLIGILLRGVILWTAMPLELFFTVQRWFGKAKEHLTRLSTDYTPGLSQWTGDEEEGIVLAVKTVSTKINGDRGGHFMEYGMAPQVYNRMVQQVGGEEPKSDVFASRDAPQLRKCTRHWHKGDSAWSKH